MELRSHFRSASGTRSSAAYPVGEEQLGHREAPIAVPDLQDMPPEGLTADDHVVLEVNGRFGSLGGAGGVEQECHVVPDRRRRGRLSPSALQEYRPRELLRLGFPDHDQMLEKTPAGPDRLERR